MYGTIPDFIIMEESNNCMLAVCFLNFDVFPERKKQISLPFDLIEI